MSKVMFILSSICRGLEFWSVNHTSRYKNSGKNNKILGWKIFNNCSNYLLGTKVYKTLKSFC